MIGRLYELAWRPTTKRPWTFQIRDWASHHPYRVWPIVALCVVVFVGLQMVAPMELGWWALPVVLFADFLAFLAAHLWWGGGEARPVSDFQ